MQKNQEKIIEVTTVVIIGAGACGLTLANFSAKIQNTFCGVGKA